MTELNCLYTNPPTEGKFVAFYDDGSGAGLFLMRDGKIVDAADGAWSIDDIEELPEHGYGSWLPIPDSYKFWFERE